MNKQEAVQLLADSDHSFLPVAAVRDIGGAFGVELRTYRARDTRSEFKGLTLHGENPETHQPYKEGDTMEGQDADRLAMQLCSALNLPYQEFFGRGSQRSHCVDVLRKTI